MVVVAGTVAAGMVALTVDDGDIVEGTDTTELEFTYYYLITRHLGLVCNPLLIFVFINYFSFY